MIEKGRLNRSFFAKDVRLVNDSWQEIQVTIHHESQEALTEILNELGAQGVAIEGNALIEEARRNNWGDYFPVPESSNEDHVTVKAYFYEQKTSEDLENLAETAKALKEFGLEVGTVKVTASLVYEQDWANAWKAHYHTTVIDNVVIQPSWETYTPSEGQIHIVLDPGMAFGTGTHPTTSMCIQALQNIEISEKRVWDIGTGSGLLAITASKLGASQVRAVDIDPVAVKVANENAKINQVNLAIDQGSLSLLTGKADIIVANIIADIIIDLFPDIVNKLKLNGLFIASGIIKDRATEVLDQAREYGFNVKFQQYEGEWVCYCFELGARKYD